MSILEHISKKKDRKKQEVKSERKEYKPNSGLLVGKNDKFVMLKGYRKI